MNLQELKENRESIKDELCNKIIDSSASPSDRQDMLDLVFDLDLASWKHAAQDIKELAQSIYAPKN